jgi:hypothetical protein
LSSSGRESRVWPLGVGEMAEIICLPTGIARASKPHSQPAQKYAENSGFALFMESAPARQAGSVSSLLGVLQYAFAGVTGAVLALAYDGTLTPFITSMLLCAVAALIAFVVATKLTAETTRPFDGRTVERP